jgi:hypothetical protein
MQPIRGFPTSTRIECATLWDVRDGPVSWPERQSAGTQTFGAKLQNAATGRIGGAELEASAVPNDPWLAP